MSPAVAKVNVTAPANSKAVRYATFGTDYPAGTDIDLFVYQDGELVGQSAGGTADEEVTLLGGGTFEVYVVQFALAGGRTEQDVHLKLISPLRPGLITGAGDDFWYLIMPIRLAG